MIFLEVPDALSPTKIVSIRVDSIETFKAGDENKTVVTLASGDTVSVDMVYGSFVDALRRVK